MSKLFSKFLGFFSSRTLAGVDKAGNRYFTRVEEIDGLVKEKRWVIFKGEEDPTSVPVEWICWLNGQRKKAPTPEEMAELEARRGLVKQNVALLKKQEEEEKKSGVQQKKAIGKGGSPDLKSFIQQFPDASFTPERAEPSDVKDAAKKEERSAEPTGSGATYKPGTWQPPS
ncbi:mimitin, mitochondrial isoform X1 [Canna indica]|uniref:NADH dehydrogenase [ubiquinone] 1 alpha subcomplex subunit 12 n=1 Tax=Canna indica TaxID=4628 RepID=A0AAQ3KZB4_9LILI|nr:mimitin, mitochondrial isoform X1 [Canna indica]